MIKRCCVLALLAVAGMTVFAQTNFLSRKVSLDIPSCSLEVALIEIGKAADFRFSYDAGMIPGSRMVKVKAMNTSVSTLLKEILGKDMQPREIGNHVILVKSRAAAAEKKTFPDMLVTGTILDAADRRPILNATVYEIQLKRSAITNSKGIYKLTVPTGRKVMGLTYCRAGYADTVIFIRQAEQAHVRVLLRPLHGGLVRMNALRASVPVNATDSMKIVNWLVPGEALVNAQNLEVRTARTMQLSVIPYIGTNWKVTGSITNRFSLNLIAGYTGGLRGLEVGGLMNISRNTVNGFQIGGLGNIAGGRVKGWQIGGLFNFDMGRFEGVQVGGLFNFVPDTISGVQIGGLTNVVTGKVSGVQICGLAGIVTHSCDAIQISGLLNLVLRDVRKLQLAGLVNYGNNVDGVQVAGLVNIARRHNSGVQVAGLVNYATMVHGLQLGLVNVSNTVERGVPVGLFSYVKSGYHLFELSGNEIFYGNVAFKSGTRAFYNFVQIGIGSSYKLQGSYGIGTIFSLSKKLSLNIDASAGLVYHPVDTVYHGLLVKFNPALEYRFAKHFALFAGPAYNFFLFSKDAPSATSRGLSTYDFYFKSTLNASMQMWIGGVLGVRF